MRGLRRIMLGAIALVTLGAAPAAAAVYSYVIDIKRIIGFKECNVDSCEYLNLSTLPWSPQRLTFSIDEAVLGRKLESSSEFLYFGSHGDGQYQDSRGKICGGRNPALTVYQPYVLGVETCAVAGGMGWFEFGENGTIRSFTIDFADGPPDASFFGTGDGIARMGSATARRFGGYFNQDGQFREGIGYFEGVWTVYLGPPPAVPAPASAALLATSLGGFSLLSLWKRRRRR